ncbi:TraX family protein [Pseudoxanthomonas putridarboris]|uniref:TraX family protein n=1 Tax=Pseudoxanthomonas putridarboris TaxID=752605 RepID=A0ABU9IZJ9_9GAMM
MSFVPLHRTSDAVLTSGGRELLKWLALALMTGDHVNKVLLDGGQPWLTDISRVVFPIFAVVFVCNLRLEEPGMHGWNAALRTLVSGLLVQPLHAWAFGYWLPANVLLTLSAGALVLLLWKRSPLASIALFVFAGLWVDYSWFGLGIMVAAALAFSRGGACVAFLGLAVGLLVFINGNFYALAALPLIAVVGRLPVDVPRWRWTFLAYYVGHLGALVVLDGLS